MSNPEPAPKTAPNGTNRLKKGAGFIVLTLALFSAVFGYVFTLDAHIQENHDEIANNRVFIQRSERSFSRFHNETAASRKEFREDLKGIQAKLDKLISLLLTS